jgi:hypothetical protein
MQQIPVLAPLSQMPQKRSVLRFPSSGCTWMSLPAKSHSCRVPAALFMACPRFTPSISQIRQI